ncbi:tetratricopeptide repeat protein [Ruminiclostridium josui]|uniref:tetratricopeptide repeat protein n=1 Tax=Ruminiclostridium josui TaxID=1499 RepID=UPI0004668444|nr:tetratricopeptide repeat protein [Ruminiclostridium josui]
MKNNLLSIDEYRNNPEFYFYKGLRCANKRNLNDAYKNLVKAAELSPDNMEYKFNIACFLSEMQRPREANRIFMDILLHYDPTMHDCYFGMGCNSFELGDMKKAAEYFEKYIYFESDGEFSEEVSEMIFYLKLYNDIAGDNRFLKLSQTNLKKAHKNLLNNKTEEAVSELYKAIAFNPMNTDARNLLILILLEQQNYKRASNFIATVTNIYSDDIWANSLKIYNLYHTRKYSRVEKLLKILPYRSIYNRKDLLCIATTLIMFNKINELINLLETYIVEYSDLLICSLLLIGYISTRNYSKATSILKNLQSISILDTNFSNWIKKVSGFIKYDDTSEISVLEEYKEIFRIIGEPEDYMYSPFKYIKIFENASKPRQRTVKKIPKKYNSVVECVVLHKEIMYVSEYEKEIIQILYNAIYHTGELLTDNEKDIVVLSAAIEYIYCKENFIRMEKEELIQKYGISSVAFNKVLKKIKYK